MNKRMWVRFFSGGGLGVVLCLAPPVAAAPLHDIPGNLLENHGFESASLGWAPQGNVSLVMYRTDPLTKGIPGSVRAQSGIHYVDVARSAASAFVTQKVSLQADQFYRVSGYFNPGVGHNATAKGLGVDHIQASLGGQNLLSSNDNHNVSWQFFATTIVAAGGQEALRVGGHGSNFGIGFDDLAIVSLAPEVDARYGLLPAAFAAGLLLLLREERRAWRS